MAKLLKSHLCHPPLAAALVGPKPIAEISMDPSGTLRHECRRSQGRRVLHRPSRPQGASHYSYCPARGTEQRRRCFARAMIRSAGQTSNKEQCRLNRELSSHIFLAFVALLSGCLGIFCACTLLAGCHVERTGLPHWADSRP